MSSDSRRPQSGLGTVKRDWSHSVERIDPDPKPWDPNLSTIKNALSKREQRLKHIRDALAGKAVPSEEILTDASSKVVNKRPATMSDKPDAKRRSLASSQVDLFKPTKSGVLSSSTNWSTSSSSRTSDPGPRSIPSVSSSKAAKKPATVFLSPEQLHIKKLVEEGQSIFYTGSAGTGKSVLLREIIDSLRRKYRSSQDAVAVTASTGLAACNIGGVTIHSFGGIGLGVESAEHLADKIKKNRKATTRWLRTKVLVIDEVSMIDGDLFDKLARIGSILRKKVEPFGGIQLVVTGDFFQLPPVTRGSNQVKFAFEAATWGQTMKRTFNLTRVFRQSDQEFIDMLNEMRFGTLSSDSIAKFKSLAREIIYNDGLGPTELFPRREDVDRSNEIRMQGLKGEQYQYRSYDGGTIQDPQQRKKLLSNFMATDCLNLRVGAQVMLIKNVDESLVNGSMGRVIAFFDAASYGGVRDEDKVGAKGAGHAAKVGPGEKYPEVEFTIGRTSIKKLMIPETWKVELPDGTVQVSRTQVPLILSWAMSIHKSQGQTLERVKVDLGKVFEKGQAYVALSRATSLDGLQVLNFDPKKVNAHPKVAQWSKTLETVK